MATVTAPEAAAGPVPEIDGPAWWEAWWDHAVASFGSSVVRLADELRPAARQLHETPSFPREAIGGGFAAGFRPVRALLVAGFSVDDVKAAAAAATKPSVVAMPRKVSIDPTRLDKKLINRVGIELCQRHFALPHRIDLRTKQLVVVVTEERPLVRLALNEFHDQIDEVEGARVEIADYKDVAASFEFLTATEDDPEEAEDQEATLSDAAKTYSDLTGTDDPETAPEGQFLKALLSVAFAWNSADVHLHTEVNASTGLRQFVARMDWLGELVIYDTMDARRGDRIMARIRALSEMGHDTVRPQDANLAIVEPNGNARYDLRISAVPLVDGCQMMTMRLLPLKRPDLSSLDKLFPPEEMPEASRLLREAINQPDGLILVTGRTGDGKSTTLAAMISEIADHTRKIVTAEDPVEYRIPSANQVQVSTARQFGFGDALRAFLRSAPDVIMVGEIRDEDTAEAAVRAAETGHLVCSTLHVKDAASAITRLRGLAVDVDQIASSLTLVVSQRLVRTLCKACNGTALDAEGEECRNCHGSKWGSRAAVVEALTVTDDLVALLAQPVPPTPTQIRALQPVTFADHAKVLLEAGRTTPDEIKRVFGTDLNA